MSSNNATTTKGPALVFGASGEQGRAVVEGMVDAGHYPVYAFARYSHLPNNSNSNASSDKNNTNNTHTPVIPATTDYDLSSSAEAASTSHNLAAQTYLTDALGATLIAGDLQNPDNVLQALLTSKAPFIFLVTTMDLPPASSKDDSSMATESGFSDAMQAEYQVIVTFFHLVKQATDQDGIGRHVVLSTRDNVQAAVKAHQAKHDDEDVWIQALEDGSIVPHYSAKGRGGEDAHQFVMEINKKDNNSNLKLTRLTLPFLYSNFLGFFCPLATDGRHTQWTLSACFGDKPIDMMGAQDLAVIVPNIFAQPDVYNGQNLRLVGERIRMEQVAACFEDLYGKPVIYNPLTVEEVAALPFAAAPAMAQMGQFVADPRELKHDLAVTQQVFAGSSSSGKQHKKQPQTFQDWLLTHSESSAFQKTGLTLDAPEIKSVTVFGATSPEGISVVKGLLADKRKTFQIRATSRDITSDAAIALAALSSSSSQITLVQVDLENVESCQKAVEGVDGVFLVTHFLQENHSTDAPTEERHMRHVIDACEAAQSVRHVVFSTLESADVIRHMQTSHDLGLEQPVATESDGAKDASVTQFDARARAASYARTKELSVTFVLLPYYSERFFDMLKHDENDLDNKAVRFDADKQNEKVVCMSVDYLGEAVANIFDSYQVYSGHEIGLVTDLVSYAQVKEIVEQAMEQQQREEEEEEPADVDADGDVTMQPQDDDEGEKEQQEQLEPKDTYMKDLGQMFGHLAHSDAVRMRKAVAKTMKLVPSARPLGEWIEQNMNNEAFREKLGLR